MRGGICGDSGKERGVERRKQMGDIDFSGWHNEVKKMINDKKDKETNGDKIRTMSNTELASELLFFRSTDIVFSGTEFEGKPAYIGLDGEYYRTGKDAVEANLAWLNSHVE